MNSGKPMSILVQLRGLRKRVAERAGVSRSFVSNVISGKACSEQVTAYINEEFAALGLTGATRDDVEIMEDGLRKYELYKNLAKRVASKEYISGQWVGHHHRQWMRFSQHQVIRGSIDEAILKEICAIEQIPFDKLVRRGGRSGE